MALNIKSPDTERDVRQLAELTGESLTEAVHQAVRERLERVGRQSRRMDEARWERVEAIVARAQAIAQNHDLTEDEILGYDVMEGLRDDNADRH